MHIAHRLTIPPSATLAMNALAAQKKQAGERVYNLSVGEPIIDTPAVIVDAAVEALKKGKTYYTPAAGIPELRAAAAQWLNTQTGASYSAAETLVTNGGKYGLFGLCQALLEPGDEALIARPYWVTYPTQVSLVGATPVIIETTEQNNWKLTPEDVAAHATSNTRVLFLNNAANPTGSLYTKTEIRAILDAACSRNMMVISDEVYSGLVYDGQSFVSAAAFPEFREHVVIVQSCSKNFAMTGWRVGFVFAPAALIHALDTLQGQSTSNTASVSQWAAVAALEHAGSITPAMCAEMQQRRDVCRDALREAFGVNSAPASGLYAFIPLSALAVGATDSVSWCLKLLEEANVATVPGAAFGQEGYIRLSFGGKPNDIREAIRALGAWTKSGL